LQAPELSSNVEALLVAVKATNDFEQEMAKRFSGGDGADAAADDVTFAFPLPSSISMLHLHSCSYTLHPRYMTEVVVLLICLSRLCAAVCATTPPPKLYFL
jgi:hypothetical protein